jgi:uncharacterized membrane protein YphA (DoxX/SURF4 family)
MNTNSRNLVGWLLSLFLAYEFGRSAYGNLTAQPRMVESFHTFGYPLWFMTFTGAVELLAVVLVLIPRVAVVGAAILICVMIGALYSHLAHGQSEAIRLPAILLVASIALAWVRSVRPARRQLASPATR